MWTKICGVTSASDAVMVADAGANAIGLNFFSQSRRFVGGDTPSDVIGRAVEIATPVRSRVDLVGVFVNADNAWVQQVARQVGLHAVQFHGDESVEQIVQFHQQCPEVGLIRAFRIGEAGTAAMDSDLAALRQRGVPLSAVLVDALVTGEYGGTGHTVDTELVRSWQARSTDHPRLVLAGGLRPDNVAQAAQAAAPWGIDTASGVESSPGVKDPEKVTDFVQAIRAVAASPATCRLADAT